MLYLRNLRAARPHTAGILETAGPATLSHMALYRRATTVLRPVADCIIRQEARVTQRCMSGKSTFEDKEHAMEDMYIKKAEENLLKKLLAKIKDEETKPKDNKAATKELKKILGDVPEDVAKKLLDWKEKH